MRFPPECSACGPRRIGCWSRAARAARCAPRAVFEPVVPRVAGFRWPAAVSCPFRSTLSPPLWIPSVVAVASAVAPLLPRVCAGLCCRGLAAGGCRRLFAPASLLSRKLILSRFLSRERLAVSRFRIFRSLIFSSLLRFSVRKISFTAVSLASACCLAGGVGAGAMARWQGSEVDVASFFLRCTGLVHTSSQMFFSK